MATVRSLGGDAARRIGSSLGRRLSSSALVGAIRGLLAGHVRRRDAAVRRRRLTRMTRTRDAFTWEVREAARETRALRRQAIDLLAGWVDAPDGIPAGEVDAFRSALAGNVARLDAARDTVPALRACYRGAVVRQAVTALDAARGMAVDLGERVEARLAALDDPEKRLLLRAAGPTSLVIEPDAAARRTFDDALRAFVSSTDAALHRAGAARPGRADPSPSS